MRDIKKVGVLGAGVMGHGIAAHLVGAEIPTLLLDIVPPKFTEADAKVYKNEKDPLFRNRFALAGIEFINNTEPTDIYTQPLIVPTVITAQNGAVINQSTKVSVTGCSGVKGAKAKALSAKQKLKRALVACRKRYRHNRSRRAACDRKAREAYAKTKKAKTKKGKGKKATQQRGVRSGG